VSESAAASALYSLKMGQRVDFTMRKVIEQVIDGRYALLDNPDLSIKYKEQIKKYKDLDEDGYRQNKIKVAGLIADFNLLMPDRLGLRLDGDIRQYITIMREAG
jgi:hypothetical protein